MLCRTDEEETEENTAALATARGAGAVADTECVCGWLWVVLASKPEGGGEPGEGEGEGNSEGEDAGEVAKEEERRASTCVSAADSSEQWVLHRESTRCGRCTLLLRRKSTSAACDSHKSTECWTSRSRC
jgi:hypothetical protein